MIDSYEFGRIVINGKKYTSDVIIYSLDPSRPGKVNSNWWRKEGHELNISDLEDVIEKKSDYVVVGTGDPGLMQVLPETRDWIQSKGIKLIVEHTKKACQTYNELSSTNKVIALLHLTC